MCNAIDKNTAAYLSWAGINRWLGIRLDFIGALITFFTAILCASGSVTAGGAGLLLTYAVTVTRTLAGSVRTTSQMEVQFNAAERVLQFSEIPPEEDTCSTKPTEVHSLWPSRGEIQWRGVSCRYHHGQELVLDSIDISVPGGTSLGICGRTGSGKSSLMMTLLRVLSCESGSIKVDSVDISGVPIGMLRRSMAVIPQEPVHIARTVREAIDPQGTCSETFLLEKLKLVGLVGQESERSSNEGDVHLDLELKEGGKNISVGQRQLLCLCRALVAEKRVLLLDEATAHVDEVTASRLRLAVQALRGKHTLVVIAHRLEDVAVCDIVVVLDNGRVSQSGSPQELMESDGQFSVMVRQLGTGQ
eukprot:CAMPEP_0184313786 /NCGR_PEP_ID=MMETSP1049-20130417/67604_1 /TAXON_ID=77928 /ORGANISM="Proteomonas sulcata, Strain CCMP704" /LENGTH=359 /DNA_ID=CAMNT_0026631287 /DNA_START=20 /DNA_END=1099 /DNA_ORIENTATION=-